MKYLCLVYHDEDAKVAERPAEEQRQIELDVREFIGDLRQSGLHIVASPLQPDDTAATMRQSNGQVTVTDGPFVETKEQLAGFYLFEARDFNDAIRIISKSPSARFGSIEVRPLNETLYMPPGPYEDEP